MLFSEGHQEWRGIPAWVHFLTQFGYGWPSGSSRPKRIALVSMPCDSAAAGLITLGALVRDLEHPIDVQNDVGAHHERLLGFAQQYLNSCRRCEMRCHPD